MRKSIRVHSRGGAYNVLYICAGDFGIQFSSGAWDSEGTRAREFGRWYIHILMYAHTCIVDRRPAVEPVDSGILQVHGERWPEVGLSVCLCTVTLWSVVHMLQRCLAFEKEQIARNGVTSRERNPDDHDRSSDFT